MITEEQILLLIKQLELQEDIEDQTSETSSSSSSSVVSSENEEDDEDDEDDDVLLEIEYMNRIQPNNRFDDINAILSRLILSQSEYAIMLRQLEKYVYVSRPEFLKYRLFTRWIKLDDEQIVIRKGGGWLCRIQPNGVCTCVIPKCNRFVSFHYSKCLVFQKVVPGLIDE